MGKLILNSQVGSSATGNPVHTSRAGPDDGAAVHRVHGRRIIRASGRVLDTRQRATRTGIDPSDIRTIEYMCTCILYRTYTPTLYLLLLLFLFLLIPPRGHLGSSGGRKYICLSRAWAVVFALALALVLALVPPHPTLTYHTIGTHTRTPPPNSRIRIRIGAHNSHLAFVAPG